MVQYEDSVGSETERISWHIKTIRFPRTILLELCTEMWPALAHNTARSHVLPVPIQVLTTLGFLATRAFQRELADRSGRANRAWAKPFQLCGTELSVCQPGLSNSHVIQLVNKSQFSSCIFLMLSTAHSRKIFIRSMYRSYALCKCN